MHVDNKYGNLPHDGAVSTDRTWCRVLMQEEVWHETLLLWLVESPWYRTAKCQPSSLCMNSKGKCNDATWTSLICSNSPSCWCKIRLIRLQYYRPSKMAATSSHMGYQIPGLANRKLRTYKILIFRQVPVIIPRVNSLDLVKAGLLPRFPCPSHHNTTSHIYLCFHIIIENIKKGQVQVAPKYVLNLRFFFLYRV
jgi:hypothetical protein